MNDIPEIKKEFDKMKIIRSEIKKVFVEIESKISILKTIYLELLSTHQETSYIFGLDSFHFQNKMIESDYAHICQTFLGIDNRIYCEYYKLYKIIHDYIKTEIHDTPLLSKCQTLHKKFPVYKDLDASRNYEFTTTNELHQTIMQVLFELGEFLKNKTEKLDEDNKQYKKGLYIDNMIHTTNYSNAILLERINMFIRFMEAFNKHHTTYLQRLLTKSRHIIDVINEDITVKSQSSSPLTPSEPVKIFNVPSAFKPFSPVILSPANTPEPVSVPCQTANIEFIVKEDKNTKSVIYI
jgi:hypothetical protein